MQLRDLMDLIQTAEFLEDYETGMGKEYADINVEHYKNLPDDEFERFLEDVDRLVRGVIALKETSL